MELTTPLIGVVVAAPAVDRFHRVAALHVGRIHRPVEVVVRAGGKGFNVGRAASTLGGRVLLAAPLAGDTGRWIERSARAEAMDVRATWIPGENRTCLSVASDADGSLTEFYEPPPSVEPSDWARFVRDALDMMGTGTSGPGRGPDAVLVSGRLPPGAPDDGLRVIVGPLVRRGMLVCLDADGPGLRGALTERAAVVKLNAVEAAALLGHSVDGVVEALSAARAIRALGPRCVVITLGRDGAVVAGEDGVGWRVGPVADAGRYPVGSGDAFLAGLGVGLARAMPLSESLRLAAGAAAANAEMPGAGVLDPVRAAEIAAATDVSLL
jgi:1-phosphofructokinase family hexose kinase